MAYNDSLSNIEWIEVGREPSETNSSNSSERIETERRYEPDALGNLYKQTRSRTVNVSGETATIWCDVTYEARALTAARVAALVRHEYAATGQNLIDCRAARATPDGMFTVTKVVRESEKLKEASEGTSELGEWSEWGPEIPEPPPPPQWQVTSITPNTENEEETSRYLEYEHQWVEIVSRYKVKDGSLIPDQKRKLLQTRQRSVTKTETYERTYNDTTSTITGVTYSQAIRYQAAAYQEAGIQSASIQSAGDNLYSVTKVVRDEEPISETGPETSYDYGDWSDWSPEPPEPPEAPGGGE